MRVVDLKFCDVMSRNTILGLGDTCYLSYLDLECLFFTFSHFEDQPRPYKWMAIYGNLIGSSSVYSLSIGISIDPIGLLFPEMWSINMYYSEENDLNKKKIKARPLLLVATRIVSLFDQLLDWPLDRRIMFKKKCDVKRFGTRLFSSNQNNSRPNIEMAKDDRG